MKYKTLGQTDIEVSVICQGCWSIVTHDTTWGPQDIRDSIEAVQASLDAGVNFFDTAEGYGGGESEQILGKALGTHRKDVVIASKVSVRHLEPATLKQHCETSLQNLGSDYIDLYQLHWPSAEVPLADTLGAMAELQQAGKVRAVGVSNFGVSYLSELLQIGRVESNQLACSLLWRPIECEVAIAGGRNADQATENAKAAEVELAPDILTALADATEPVKAYVGANADMWQTVSRMERPER